MDNKDHSLMTYTSIWWNLEKVSALWEVQSHTPWSAEMRNYLVVWCLGGSKGEAHSGLHKGPQMA